MYKAVNRKNIILDYTVRYLCKRPYPNHPKGCPNFGKRPFCPPKCPYIEDYFDLRTGLILVWIEFNIGAHITRMARKHPDWSQRQKECCLYWQGTANRMLKDAVIDVESKFVYQDQWKTSFCPEAMGVNVTATMKTLGIDLEWPPQKIVRKVAIIGTRKK